MLFRSPLHLARDILLIRRTTDARTLNLASGLLKLEMVAGLLALGLDELCAPAGL